MVGVVGAGVDDGVASLGGSTVAGVVVLGVFSGRGADMKIGVG